MLQKSIRHTPAQKLTDAFIAVLAGAHGRPKSAALKEKEVRRLYAKGVSKAEIARRLQIARTSVRRLLS